MLVESEKGNVHVELFEPDEQEKQVSERVHYHGKQTSFSFGYSGRGNYDCSGIRAGRLRFLGCQLVICERLGVKCRIVVPVSGAFAGCNLSQLGSCHEEHYGYGGPYR